MTSPTSKKLAFACLLGLSAAAAQAQTPPRFETTTLSAGMHLIQAEVAQTDEQRQYGLMFREKLGPNEGMLFIFPAAAGVCMWMKNTLVPLSVAFLDEKGRIVNIEDMEPNTTDPHCARKPAWYALEMPKGWFKQKNIKPGRPISSLPKARP